MQSRTSVSPYGGFFARLPQIVRRMLRGLRHPTLTSGYRPEKHYMRGPGPKTRAGRKRSERNSDAA